MKNEIKNVPMADITQDPRLQPRAALDPETVEDYTARYAEGVAMPEVTIFYDGATYWLGDGFHRVASATKAGLDAIPADVRDGTFRDALLFAAGANAGHGLRRTNADKRRAVEMLLGDAGCAGWADREIARHCQVGAPLVGEIRTHLKEITDNPASAHLQEITDAPAARTVTRGGVTYTMNTRNIGRRSTPAPTTPNQAAAPGLWDNMPQANDESLYPCPFCGAADVKVQKHENCSMAACQSPECGAIGPRAIDLLDVQDGWNARRGPGKYEMTAPAYRN